MGRAKSLLPYLLLTGVATWLALLFSPVADPDGGLKLSSTAEEVREASLAFLVAQGIDASPLRPETKLRRNRKLIRRIHSVFGIPRGNELFRTHLPAYTWEIRWTEESGVNITVQDDEEGERVPQTDAWLRGDVRFEYTMEGRLLTFRRTIPDSVMLPSVSADSALAISRAFFIKHGGAIRPLGGLTAERLFGDSAAAPRRIELLRRNDHVHEWVLHDTVSNLPLRIRYKVSGPHLSEFSVALDVPGESDKTQLRIFIGILEALVYLALIIVLAVISFKRLRAYEIGFRLALIVGISTGLGLGVKLYTVLSPISGWEMVFPLLFGPLLYGGGAVLLWAAAETIVRETWKERIVSLDLFSRGYLFHSRIGRGIVRGIALGIFSYVAYLALIYALGRLTNVNVGYQEEETYDFVSSWVPFFSVLLEGFHKQTYTVTIFYMFVASWTFKRFGSLVTAGGAVVVLLGLLRGPQLEPVGAGIVVAVVVASVGAIAFLRFDILTAFVTLMMFTVTQQGMLLYSSGAPFYSDAALVLFGVVGFFVVAGLASQFRTGEAVDFDAIAPAFAHHISERERLRHELDIARSVQMSFLPKSNPVVPSLDIASRCAPALEVGGDYYDFINLPDKRLAVAVGDVSGKGTQAAFYMTLAKGFLRALARISQSPGVILTEVNTLFYDNVERGVFISLIYGIFDPAASRLTIARAGHNPVILRKTAQRNTQSLNPTGLALGLDAGTIFGQSIKEVSVTYEPGDVFVFYTDGISEAMNRTREEYGAERLSSSIEAHAQKDASGILDGVLTDMRQFVGKAEQHDDVTLVVVKIV